MRLRACRAVCLFLLAASTTGSLPLRAQQSAPATDLGPGTTIDRALGSGDSHSFAFDLSAGEFLHIVVEQRGIDVVAQLVASDGTTAFTEDSPNGMFGPERVAYIASASGRYHLNVISLVGSSSVPAGRYELRVMARRPADAEDFEHATAERAFAEAEQLRVQNTMASRLQAIAGFAAALSIFERLGFNHEEALAAYCTGLTYLRGGQTREAVPHLSRAVSIFKQLQVTMYASAVNALGGSYDLLGDTANAQSHYQLSLEYFRRHGAVSGEGLAHNNLGKLYADTADWLRALNEYRQALPLFRKVADRNREALALYNIGMAYAGLGDYERGIEYLQLALALRRQTGDRVGQADALTGIGRVQIVRHEPLRAIEYLKQALTLRQVVGDQRSEGVTISFLGEAYLGIGDNAQALHYLQRAAELRASGGDRRGAALTLLILSKAYAAEGRSEAGIAAASEALTVFRDMKDRSSEARALMMIAQSERRVGRLAESLEHNTDAISALEEVRGRVASPEFRASYMGRQHEIYKLQIDLLMDLHEREPAAGYAARGLAANERARARSLLDMLTEADVDIRRGVDSGLVDRERQLAKMLSVKTERLMPLLARDRKSEPAQALLREIGTLEAEYEELRASVRRTSPAYAALTQSQPADLATIQRDLLDNETTLLEYSLGDEASYAWIVDRASLRSYRLAPKLEIEKAAREAYELVTARGMARGGETAVERQRRVSAADAALPGALRRLSDLVLKPITPLPATSRLLVVADGALQYIPLGMLPLPATSGSTRPMVEDFEIVTTPSVSVMAAQAAQISGRSRPQRGIAVIADPVFDQMDPRVTAANETRRNETEPAPGETRILEHFASVPVPGMTRSVIPRLPYTRNEADAILAVAKGQKNFTSLDFAATKEAVVGAALKDYRIVHFATHGFLDTERPSLSSIVLSLVDRNGRRRDGFLRANELYNMDLNAELVVLSACQTGLGKSIDGEGLIGLTRGLMYAGAARVVVSLWNVSDRATASLMGRFYSDMLVAGKPPSAALRAAQLALRQQKGWENPYYWAAFVIQGDWRNTSRPAN